MWSTFNLEHKEIVNFVLMVNVLRRVVVEVPKGCVCKLSSALLTNLFVELEFVVFVVVIAVILYVSGGGGHV